MTLTVGFKEQQALGETQTRRLVQAPASVVLGLQRASKWETIPTCRPYLQVQDPSLGAGAKEANPLHGASV